MDQILEGVSGIVSGSAVAVVQSLAHNALPLSLAIVTAVLMKVYIDTARLREFLLKRRRASIGASVLLGAATPLCACGTMAVVIGLLTTALPWGPIMAFLTSSPLMSPDGFIMLAGIVNIRFAIALLLASIVIGLGSGFITSLIERKTSFLDNQSRFSESARTGQAKDVSADVKKSVMFASARPACGCAPAVPLAPRPACDCPSPVVPAGALDAARPGLIKRLRLEEVARAFVDVGLKQILFFFAVFVAIGYAINALIPSGFIVSLFSGNSPFAIPLAALIGLPLYVSGEAAIPLINALTAAGAGEGAMLAFMITGQATSAWVIAGISSFMKGRIIGLYLAFIIAGALLSGYGYSVVLACLR